MGIGFAMAGGLGTIGGQMRQDYQAEHQNALENLTGFMNFLRSQAQNESFHPNVRSIWGGWYGQLASAPVTGRLKMAEQIHKEAERLGQTILVGHRMITDGGQPPANLPPGVATLDSSQSAMQAPPQTLYGAPRAQSEIYSSEALERAKRLGDISAAEAWSDYFKKQGVADEEIPFHVEAMLGRPMPSGFFLRTVGGTIMTGKQANEEGYLQSNKQPWPDDAIVRPTIQKGQKVGLPSIGPTSPVTVPDTSGTSPTGTAVGRATLGGQVLGAVPNIDPRLAGTQQGTATTQTPTGTVTQRSTKKVLPGQASGAQPPTTRAGGGPQAFLKPAAQKIFQPMFEAETRLRTMTQNLQDGLGGDQQAMVSLVINHISMVLGIPLGKVGRPSQQLIKEAEEAAPWLGRLGAHFDNRGYLSGVVLTADQMKQMVHLAKNLYINNRRQVQEQSQLAGIGNLMPNVPTDIQGILGRGVGMKAPPAGATHIGTDAQGQDHYLTPDGRSLGLIK